MSLRPLGSGGYLESYCLGGKGSLSLKRRHVPPTAAEILSEGARLIKRALCYPVFMLMLLEGLVFDVGHATAYFLRSTWLRVGFDLLRTHANYKRDYLLPRLNQDGLLEKKPASYADAMVATAGLLGILGLPLEVQGYWTEHSERSVLPTGPVANGGAAPGQGPAREVEARGLRHLGSPDSRHSSLRWPEGADRHDRLDEREIAADLVPWLMERAKLVEGAGRANG